MSKLPPPPEKDREKGAEKIIKFDLGEALAGASRQVAS